MKLFTAVFAVALLATGQALACSRADWNRYEDFAERRQPVDFERAAFVEWVSLDAPPPLCPRQPEDPNDPWACDNQPITPEIGALAPTATVIERLKGGGPDRFELVRTQETPMMPMLPDGRRGFQDLRHLDLRAHAMFALRDKTIADSGHRDDSFWDGGELGGGDQGCPMAYGLELTLNYLVFRTADGRVFAAEPVMSADDQLLQRLRGAAAGAPVRPTRPVADFFRTTPSLVLVKVRKCHNGPYYSEDRAKAEVLRGDASAFVRIDNETGKPNTAGAHDFDFLSDWAESRGKRCVWGEVLIAGEPFAPTRKIPADEVWLNATFPGLPPEWRRDLFEVLGSPPSANDLPRPAVVRDGKVRTVELLTGFRLEGPEEITVDQAFAWFAEGRAAAGDAR